MIIEKKINYGRIFHLNGVENKLQVHISMSMDITFGHGYEYVYKFLKIVHSYVPDLLVKGNQNTVKSKNKCYE